MINLRRGKFEKSHREQQFSIELMFFLFPLVIFILDANHIYILCIFLAPEKVKLRKDGDLSYFYKPQEEEVSIFISYNVKNSLYTEHYFPMLLDIGSVYYRNKFILHRYT